MQISSQLEEALLSESKGEDWSSAEFCDQVKKALASTTTNKILKCSSSGYGNHEVAIIQFYNVPTASGGAKAENNRVMLTVDGFGKKEGEPSPSGKVKFSVDIWSPKHIAGIKRPRGKTGAPAAILKTVVDAIKQAAALETR